MNEKRLICSYRVSETTSKNLKIGRLKTGVPASKLVDLLVVEHLETLIETIQKEMEIKLEGSEKEQPETLAQFLQKRGRK